MIKLPKALSFFFIINKRMVLPLKLINNCQIFKPSIYKNGNKQTD